MTTVNNAINYGRSAINAGTPDESDIYTDVVDTLANIMHFCRANNIDPEQAYCDAELHYTEERDQ